jgi:hypothetical protein
MRSNCGDGGEDGVGWGGGAGSGEGDGFFVVGDAVLVDEGFGLVDGERFWAFEVVGLVAGDDGLGEVVGFVFGELAEGTEGVGFGFWGRSRVLRLKGVGGGGG